MAIYNVWLEPAGTMLLDVKGDTPQEMADNAAAMIRRTPPPHLHPESRIEVSKLRRGRYGREIVARVTI